MSPRGTGPEADHARGVRAVRLRPDPGGAGARSFHAGWLVEVARIGKGGNDRYFYGLHLLLILSAAGVATGWTLAAGNVQERWLAELVLSARAGCPQLVGPLDPKTGKPTLPAPEEWVGPVQSCGTARGRPIVSDRGFTGADWLTHWAQAYGATVIPKLGKRAPRVERWMSRLRQVIETAFAHLLDAFGSRYPGAHARWGLVTRVAAKVAAYDLGIQINRQLGRPDFAFATLIV
jgi:hypothetical protein